ncbi:MAG: hypothetical protein HOK62_08890 [Verrucomicrobiales bacterium]|nr:hypothetical protein [Verrucomicrobiales bacterium]
MAAKQRFDVPRMRRDFLNSDITLRDLAKRHGCSYRYVSGLSSQERWYPQRRELKAQQESAVTEALVERVAARSSELAQLKALTAVEHVGRSLQVGEQLHVLLQQALAALEAQDVRRLKAAQGGSRRLKAAQGGQAGHLVNARPDPAVGFPARQGRCPN